MASLHFPIADIPEEGLEFTRQVVRDELFLDDGDPATEDEFTVSARLSVAGADVVVRGELLGTLRLDCDRCLNRFHQPLRLSYEGIFVPGEDERSSVVKGKRRASDDPVDEFEAYVIQDDCVMLGEMLREQVILSVPMHPLCNPDCKGLCVQCGENLNVQQCNCPPGNVVSPFSILRNLVKSSEPSRTP